MRAWRPSGCLISLAVLLLLAAGLGLSVRGGLIDIPPNWIPWNAPRLDEKPALFAHMQINRLSANRDMCLDTLAEASKLKFSPLADRKVDGDCILENIVRLEKMPFPLSAQVSTTCTLGAAFYWWQRQIDAVALRELGSAIAEIHHVGAFACRNVNSAEVGNRSQHAYANAIDIDAFVTKDGRTISISRNWDKDSAEGRFLKAVHDEACRFFNGVLGPDYNKLHASHFHLDMGPYWICR